MNQAPVTDTANRNVDTAATDPDAAEIIGRVSAYLGALGLTDEVLIASLAGDCLARARRREARGADHKLLRRALEEAQRRFDHALAAAVGLPPLNDPHPIAAARAALLLSANGLSANSLFAHDDSTRELGAQLQKVLPQPTPAEDHLSVTVTPFSFWLFKSTDH